MKNNWIHGSTGTPEYKIWVGMKKRCYNPSDSSYSHYGGRGITVCERWRNDFVAFLEDMGTRTKGLTLERKNNNGNYEPGNCRWATRKEQTRNARHNIVLEFNGIKQCLAAWAEEMGQRRTTVQSRLDRGWSVERALTEKVHTKTGGLHESIFQNSGFNYGFNPASSITTTELLRDR